MKWHVEIRKFSELKVHPSNPRKLSKHDGENLKKSLEKFGLVDRPVITKDGSIIGGHQRIALLKKMGHKEVECLVPDEDMQSEDVSELLIRLNRAHGEFDYDILANEFDVKDLLDWGFTPEELTIDVTEEDSEEDESSGQMEPPKDPKTKLGDLYVLGNHRLLCGDSTNGDNISLLFDGGKYVPMLMVTDPPYGVEYDPSWRSKAGKGNRATGKVQNDDKINWALAWHLFPGSVAYVWHAGKYCSEVQKSLEEAEFEVISQIIWMKQHFALSRGDYHWQHEPCWYAVKKGHKHNWQGARDQATTWEIANLNAFGGDKKKDSDDERTAHSTQKPLECMTRPIVNNTAIGEGVYDPFGGSGTTLLACEKEDRNCFMVELDPAYCDIIVQRWIKYRKKMGRESIVWRNGEIFEELNG